MYNVVMSIKAKEFLSFIHTYANDFHHKSTNSDTMKIVMLPDSPVPHPCFVANAIFLVWRNV